MKKSLFFIFIVASSFSLKAQSFSGDVTISPQFGVSLATYFTSKSGFDPRITPIGGIIGEYYFSRAFSFRSGFIYDQMGARNNAGYTQKLDYLSVPLNVNWHFGRNRLWYTNFGPSVSVLLSGKAENKEGDVIDLTDEEGPFFKELDMGMVIGIGYRFFLDQNTQMYIDYQGYGSFFDIAEKLPYKLRNSRNSFNLGIIFTFDTMKGLKR